MSWRTVAVLTAVAVAGALLASVLLAGRKSELVEGPPDAGRPHDAHGPDDPASRAERQGGDFVEGDVLLRVGDDFQEVVDDRPPGTHYVVESGLHRLQSVRPKDGDRYTGQPGSVLSGAEVLEAGDFEPRRGRWVIGGQTQQGRVHGEMRDGFERDAHPEELFADGDRLRHVSSLSAVDRPGTWFFDYDRDEIWMHDDPSDFELVETSVAEAAFVGRDRTNVVIENLVIRQYANPAQHGAIHGRDSREWLIRYTDVSYNHGVGLSVGPGMEVRNSRFAHNGQLGVGGTARGEGVTIEDNEITHNGLLGFRWTWEAGGTKFVHAVDMVFANNWVHRNEGPGAWWDTSNLDAVIRSNLVEHNEVMGIFYEISYGADIRWNVVRHNAESDNESLGMGIYVSNSSDVTVVENITYGNRGEIVAQHANRGNSKYGPREVRGLLVRDNHMVLAEGKVGLRLHADEDSILDTDVNRFEGNRYHLATEGDSFEWDATLDASDWQETGHDRNATFLLVPGNEHHQWILGEWAPIGSPEGAALFRWAHYGPVVELTE